MLVGANMFTAGARLFGIMNCADFLVFLGRDCLGKMVGAKVVIEVVLEVVVGIVVEVVRRKLKVLLEMLVF